MSQQQFYVGEMPVRGSNLIASANNLPRGYGRYLQDMFIEADGALRRRGPLKDSAFTVTTANSIRAMVYAYTPTGALRYMGIGSFGSTPETARVWSSSGSTLGDFVDTLMPVGHNYKAQWCSDFNGGAILGNTVVDGASQTLMLWRGAYAYSTNAATITSTSGSTAISAGSANFVAGHVGAFVSINGTYVGCIKTVTSTTAAVLEEGALATASSATNIISPVRGINVTPSPGLIHTESSIVSIVGSGTKFLEQGTSGSTWDIFHLRNDGTNSGVQTIAAASVTNNTNIAFGAGAGYSMDFERYKLNNRGATTTMVITTASNVLQTGRTNLNTPGCLPTAYADRIWYSNRGDSQENKSSTWFSERFQSENIDMSPTTGNKITIGSGDDRAEIVASAGTTSGLLFFKNNATYVLTGKSPSNFQVSKLLDDGAVSARSVTAYKSGVIWAGFKGIYYFDGSSVTNLVEDSLGEQYQMLLKQAYFAPTLTCSFVANDHLFVSIGDYFETDGLGGTVAARPWFAFTKAIYAPLMRGENPDYYADNYDGATSSQTYTSMYDEPTASDDGEALCLSINLNTLALVFMRNMKIYWALPVAGVSNLDSNLLVCYNQLKETSASLLIAQPAIVGTNSLFNLSGLDQIDTSYNTNRPGRSPKTAYWQTFYDNFTTGALNTNWTKVGNIDLTTLGVLKPADTTGWSLELAPVWTSGQPYNFLGFNFITGTSIVGFANRCRIYNSNKSHYVEAEVTATAIRILIDGVVKATTAFVPSTPGITHVMGFWLWGGRAHASIAAIGNIHAAGSWGVSGGTDVSYAMNATEIDYMEDSAGGGKPYFASDVAQTTEQTTELMVVPLKQSAGPRFYYDSGISSLESLDTLKWTKNAEVTYISAAGSITAYIQNDIDVDTDSDSGSLPLTVNITTWASVLASWRYWDTRNRNWPRFSKMLYGTTSDSLVDTRNITPWASGKINVGDRGPGVGIRIVQDHIQVTDVRVKSWQVGFKPMRGGRSG